MFMILESDFKSLANFEVKPAKHFKAGFKRANILNKEFLFDEKIITKLQNKKYITA